MELAEIISKQAEGIAKSLGMPDVKTTSVDEELKKTKKKNTFKTKLFVIIDDISAEDYSKFIDNIISNPQDFEIIREVENWTKDGELIRVVDYIETIKK